MSRTQKSKFVTAEAFIGRFSTEDQAKIGDRARQLVAEELTLRDLRKARDLTQNQVGEMLGIGQEHVSRLEQRADMLLSTLAGYVRAMGGDLKLVVRFPDRAPVELADLADVFETRPVMPAPRRRKNRTPSAE